MKIFACGTPSLSVTQATSSPTVPSLETRATWNSLRYFVKSGLIYFTTENKKSKDENTESAQKQCGEQAQNRNHKAYRC